MRLLAVLPPLLAATTLGQTQTTNPFPFGTLITEQSRPSFSLIGAGARSAGMGGAFTALADDAAAASFNPAGLALLILPEVTVVGGATHRDDRHAALTSITTAGERFTDTGASFDAASLNFAAVTLPLAAGERNLCVQLSYHRQVDFTFDEQRNVTQWAASPQQPTALYFQRIEQGGDIHTYSAALALELTRRLSLGLSVSRWQGEWTFVTEDKEIDLSTTQRTGFTYATTNALKGWNWNLGALLRYRYLDVGAMYRSGFDADYTFASTFTSSIATSLAGEPRQTHPLHWPASWTLGIAFKPTDTWHVTVDHARYEWSKMELREVGPDGATSVNFFDLKPRELTSTPDIAQWRLGTELTLFAGRAPVALRAGWFSEPQPQRSPEGGHQSRLTGYSAGTGVKLGRFSIDLAWQYRHGTAIVTEFLDPRAVATGKLAAQARGEMTTTEQRLFLGLLYQLPNGTGVSRALHWLFVGPDEPKGGDAS